MQPNGQMLVPKRRSFTTACTNMSVVMHKAARTNLVRMIENLFYVESFGNNFLKNEVVKLTKRHVTFGDVELSMKGYIENMIIVLRSQEDHLLLIRTELSNDLKNEIST